mgnify:CR=1 FL=1
MTYRRLMTAAFLLNGSLMVVTGAVGKLNLGAYIPAVLFCVYAVGGVIGAVCVYRAGKAIQPWSVAIGAMGGIGTAAGLETLFSSTYTITDEADRMGYRLEGPHIEHAGKADIVSDALPLGAVQVPGHGMPIIMMADRQTTGGYAKIATVIGPDLARLAQAKPGDTVRFIRCTDDEAVAALRAERQTYAAVAAWRDGRLRQSPAQKFRITVNGQTYEVEIREV